MKHNTTETRLAWTSHGETQRDLRRAIREMRGEQRRLRLGVTYENVTLGNNDESPNERGPPGLASLSHSTMIGLPRAALENA
ncbi:hypothetical protein EVAR_10625_1 [Eumeta japonica]|uniref:Uncharacterized protein n=1 Tax=Eumeta variegata TaxID=151549 RepID=A0A4C1U272_EUMVA|nr:hypothetical protein EVAR_10625_1 [Eumeta japonica]